MVGENKSWRGAGTVLVIDDDEGTRDIARLMLEGRGFQVLTAEDGKVGVDLYRKNLDEIALVLLDAVMPYDGGRVLEEILRLNPHAKVIGMSGYFNEAEAGRLFGKGLSGFLRKPFTIHGMSTLMSKIRDVLGD